MWSDWGHWGWRWDVVVGRTTLVQWTVVSLGEMESRIWDTGLPLRSQTKEKEKRQYWPIRRKTGITVEVREDPVINRREKSWNLRHQVQDWYLSDLVYQGGEELETTHIDQSKDGNRDGMWEGVSVRKPLVMYEQKMDEIWSMKD